jgi:hypothetical protein
MRFAEMSSEEIGLLERLRADPKNKGALEAAHALFWDLMTEVVEESIRGADGRRLGLTRWREVVDCGVAHPPLVDRTGPGIPYLREALQDGEPREGILTLSEYLEQAYLKVLGIPQVHALKQEIERVREERRDAEIEVKRIQMGRRHLFEKSLKANMNERGSFSQLDFVQCLAQFEVLAERDASFLQKSLRQREIAEGRFLSAEERRQQMALEEKIAQQERVGNLLLKGQLDENSRKNLQKLGAAIDALINQTVRNEGRVQRLLLEIEQLVDLGRRLTLEHRVDKLVAEVLRLRELSKLCALRSKVVPLAVLMGSPLIVSRKRVVDLLQRLDEEDLWLYRNRRVAVHGQPGLLLVPGRGQGIYDMESNLLVVPVVAAEGMDPEGSILAAFADYRWAVDDERVLQKSFAELPQHRKMTVNELRERFQREYRRWVMDEADGNMVMEEEVRLWFETNISPRKMMLLVPARQAPWAQSMVQLAEQEAKLLASEEAGSIDLEGLFRLGCIAGQREDYALARRRFSLCLERSPNSSRARFNMAVCDLKLGRQTGSRHHFRAYAMAEPAGWRSDLARDCAEQELTDLASGAASGVASATPEVSP